MSPIDITIINPFSPALIIVSSVAVVVFILLIIVSSIINDYEPALTGFFLMVIIFAFGFITITNADSRARGDRVVEQLEDLGYEHVVYEGGDISAADPEGVYVSGTVQKHDNENYTVFFR